MMSRFSKKEKGFTIVEVLIALTIFSIAITGVITVAAQGGSSIEKAKNKLTADYLASEGLELMRGMRDTAVLSVAAGHESDGWTAFLTAVTSGISDCTTSCDIDATTVAPTTTPFPAASNIRTCVAVGCILFYDPATGYYSDLGTVGTASPFTRKIQVHEVSPDELQVTSTVSWLEGSLPQSSAVTEDIFNWYP